jgi:hypothetical protein
VGGRGARREEHQRPKTLFATHYHELTDLAADMPGVGNLHVSAREWQDSVVFLRKIEPGGSDRSFGIQVARLAGLPSAVVVRAQEILANLERTEFDREGRPRLAHSEGPSPPGEGRQLALFSGPDEAVLDELRRINPDELTPMQALSLLAEIRRRLARDRPHLASAPGGLKLACALSPIRPAARPAEPAGADEPLFEASLGPARIEAASLLSPTWSPPADVFETADRFVVQIELPGVDRTTSRCRSTRTRSRSADSAC